MAKLDAFLPNRQNRLMFLGFVAFAIAAVGAALAFASQWLSVPWLGKVGFVVTAIGVLSGFAFVSAEFVYATYSCLKMYHSRAKNTRSLRAREWKP